MPKFLSSIWTSIIEYETPRLVRIHNRKLGLVRRLIQFSIVCYVLVYALWLQQGYQEFTRVESSVTVKIKGVTKSELGDGTDLDPCKYLVNTVLPGIPSKNHYERFVLYVVDLCSK